MVGGGKGEALRKQLYVKGQLVVIAAHEEEKKATVSRMPGDRELVTADTGRVVRGL